MPKKKDDPAAEELPSKPARRITDDEAPAPEAAEAIKEASAGRRREKSTEVDRGTGFDTFLAAQAGAPLDAELERQNRAESVAQAAARIAREKAGAESRAASMADEEEYQYALLCRKCGQMGIFFTKNPLNRTLYQNDWFSRMKATDEAWAMDVIPCQECFIASGEYTGLAVASVRGAEPRKGKAFSVAGRCSRSVAKFPKDPERFKREGVTMAVMTHQRVIGNTPQEA
jgi:hypothetical protein